jgi:hypothetical protein
MPRAPENAEILGLKALAWLAADEEELNRFLALSGTDPATLRHSAGDPALLGAVLDFLLAQDVLLLRFCEDEAIRPAAVHQARRTLEGPCA